MILGRFNRSYAALFAAAWLTLTLFSSPVLAVHSGPQTPSFSSAYYLNPNTGRFWTMDSYAGNNSDPLTLHKYLYCHANPVIHLDLCGFSIVLPKDPKFKADYEEAITYLKQSKKGRDIIDVLERSTEHTYTILLGSDDNVKHFFDGPNSYDPNTRNIYWRPDRGLEWKGPFGFWNRQSPAMSLIHELGHAYHHEADVNRFLEEAKPLNDRQWDTLEEKRTIKGIENVVADDLGEPTRNFHNPLHIATPDSADFYHREGVKDRKRHEPSFSSPAPMTLQDYVIP